MLKIIFDDGSSMPVIMPATSIRQPRRLFFCLCRFSFILSGFFACFLIKKIRIIRLSET